MKYPHRHKFVEGKSGKVETCVCGRFRHINLQSKDVITEIKPKPLLVTFDGFGLNDANDEYKERVATLSRHYLRYGMDLMFIINSHEALLKATRIGAKTLIQLRHKEKLDSADRELIGKAISAISQLEGK